MTAQKQTITVGGLPITPFSTIEEAAGAIFVGDQVLPGFAVAVNAEKVIAALDNREVADSLRSATLFYADGISVAKTVSKKGVENTRVPGCELWMELMKLAAKFNKKVYLLGAKERVNQSVAQKLSAEYGLSNVIRRNGYFENEGVIIEEVLHTKPDIVTVALGSPKQELLISKLRKVYPEAFYMGVGGSYDILAGEVKRAPKIFQQLNLEWLYRLLSQPKRIFRQLTLFRYAFKHMTNQL